MTRDDGGAESFTVDVSASGEWYNDHGVTQVQPP